MKHQPVRHRHELRRRRLTVERSVALTPHMIRITLTGDDLAGFTSLSPDDHIKLFLPGPGGGIDRRDYTPRHYDPATGRLTIDFAVHEAGPATRWARHAAPGDMIEIGGPKGSVVVPDDFDWWLLVGDETALPAIGRRIEELPAGTPVTSIVAVAGPDDEQQVATAADHRAIWVHRPIVAAAEPRPMIAALRSLPLPLPPGDGFIWIAAEAGVARAVRSFVLEALNHPPAWLKASGYWVHGRADASEKFDR